jgi:hypothetical protein
VTVTEIVQSLRHDLSSNVSRQNPAFAAVRLPPLSHLTTQSGEKTMAHHEILNVPMTSELIRIEMEQTQGGAVDYFLKLDGIKGETTNDKHTRSQATKPAAIVFVGGWGSSTYQY